MGLSLGDVPLFVEHCEAVTAVVDVTRRWVDEQERRDLSFFQSGAVRRELLVRFQSAEAFCCFVHSRRGPAQLHRG